MAPNPIRVYADTSVYGGCFDRQFDSASARFFEQARLGRFRPVISAIVQAEIAVAPITVRKLFDEILDIGEVIEVTDEAIRLRQAYLDAGIVTSKSANDALHVALATASRCSLIVSWNFRHIVHFQKIPLYNAINVVNGYWALAINSPSEVIEDENQDI
jgi:predicted nucleic acid-binding protein